MNSNQLVKLAAVLGVLALLVLVFNAAREGNIEKPGTTVGKDRIFKNFPVNDVSNVEIVGQEGQLSLERKESGWTVAERKGYPADVEKVAELLSSIYDLGIVQSVPVGESKFGRVGLLNPAEAETGGGGDDEKAETLATILTFSKGEDKVGELWVGKEYQKTESGQFGPVQTTTGRYVKRGNANDVYVVDEKFSNVKIEPEEWLSDDFFKVEKLRSIERIPAEAADEAWKLTREDEDGDLTLADAKEGEEIDSTKVSSMKRAFASPAFEDIVIGGDVEKPDKVIFKIETFDGFKYEVKLNEKNDENEYLLILANLSADLPKERQTTEDESEDDKEKKDKEFKDQQKEWAKKLKAERALVGHIYKVRSYVADSINKNRSELMKEPEEGENGGETESAPGVESALPGVNN